MTGRQKKGLVRIVVALALFAVAELLPYEAWLGDGALWGEFAAFFVPYLVAGADVLAKAGRSIVHGRALDENFLMAVASLGAFALVLFPNTEPHMAEGAAVMIFYQVGEWFEGYAVGRSRKSIADMMDIAPNFANVVREGKAVQVDPEEVAVGDRIVVKPGERIPLDGVVEEGSSQLDTAALTGEAVPRVVEAGAAVASGCINLTGVLAVRVTKPYAESTVTRILELVENASEKKARTENFITRFARYYTPVVVGAALLLALAPPLLFGQAWADWIERGLIFLVVSCPCALVISVPLSFFGGIGGASRQGILVKGGNYLEALSQVKTVAFDKTGTLTSGTFNVVAIHAHAGVDPDLVLSMAAHAEAYSNHPIALSVRAAYSGEIQPEHVRDVREQSGHGVRAVVEEHVVVVGNEQMLASEGIENLAHRCDLVGTVLHVSLDGSYLGHIVIADVMKDGAARAIADLHQAGVRRTVMLTGDREDVAAAVAREIGIDEYRAQLLPQDKVAVVESLIEGEGRGEGADGRGAGGRDPALADGDRGDGEDRAAFAGGGQSRRKGKGRVAFVGDGINDAPVLMRADVGIAMGAMGSDAAIEAADVVLMDDQPEKIAKAIRIAGKTMRIVWQNIVFALGVKFLVLGLAALGLANMWLAVFADVGVACLAILNAMRALRT